MWENEERRSVSIINQRSITAPCFVLCALILLVIGLLPLLPHSFTQILRPLFILSCIISARKSCYPLHKASKMQIVFLMYLGMILLCHNITGSAVTDYVSMLLFGTFFVLVAQRVWSKREILLVLNAMVLAGLFLACVLLIDNPDLIKMENASELAFFNSVKNRNTMAFSLVPGTLCSTILMTYSNRRLGLIKKVFYLATMLVCLYVLIATGARSASISALVGVYLIIWEKAREVKLKNDRLFARVTVILIAIIALFALVKLTAGTGSARIFNDIEDINGREDLWAFAEELIRQKPVFGGGFDYWTNMNGEGLGTHNTYLTIMVVSGYVGAGFLTVFLLIICFELLRARNLIPLAFIVELLCHTYSESTMDYYAYFPMILAYMLFSYLKYQDENLKTLFE